MQQQLAEREAELAVAQAEVAKLRKELAERNDDLGAISRLRGDGGSEPGPHESEHAASGWK